MAVSLAAGADPKEAAIMGNLAASVTIKKIGTTGTASPEEILKVYKDHKAKII
jgi:bifunctional ADP-heptose synthase (sugar kinase/adenylyltransferase)